MPTELITVNLTRENEKEEWGFELAGGGRDKNVRLFIDQVWNLFLNKYYQKVGKGRHNIFKKCLELNNMWLKWYAPSLFKMSENVL